MNGTTLTVSKFLNKFAIEGEKDKNCWKPLKIATGNSNIMTRKYHNYELSTLNYQLVLMYAYSFDRFAGHDRVFLWENPGKFKAGDLIHFGAEYFLVLGKTISFPEKYNYVRNSDEEAEIVYKGLLSRNNIQLLNWIVENYYSTYRASLRYFLSADLDKLLAREVKATRKKITHEGQELYLFPDLWTLMNTVDDKILNAPNNIFLNSKMSPKQKDLARRKIKNGIMHRVFCTHGEAFQDRNNLKKVHIHEAHKRYYKNQQDPRYRMPTVIEKLKEIYGV